MATTNLMERKHAKTSFYTLYKCKSKYDFLEQKFSLDSIGIRLFNWMKVILKFDIVY